MGRRGKNLAILLTLGAFCLAAAAGLSWILSQAKREIGSGEPMGLETVGAEEDVLGGGTSGLRRRDQGGSAPALEDTTPGPQGGEAPVGGGS